MALVAVAVLFGNGIRLYLALRADFPIGDGGLFYVMAQDIQAAGYALPSASSYNHDAIPLAYPPLGFYLLAAVSNSFGISALDALRLLPPFVAALTIPAFYFFARALCRSALPAASRSLP